MPSEVRSEWRAFVAQPGYGQVTVGASRGFWCASRTPNNLFYGQRTGSLLASNFNQLWCDALNLKASGKPLDYFAMLHADVEPQDFWLDSLVDELEAKRLDVLGAVVPIKDTQGLTSLALAHPTGDPWRIKGRLTMREVYDLPETFTSKDVGAPLLLNTGCWVCKFDLEWARQVRFTINDRIVLGPDGTYRPQVEPEDWYFSRLCHELGLKVGATRKIALSHAGEARYRNTHPWGTEEFDSQWCDRSPLPPGAGGGGSGFRFPHRVPGWLTTEEGRALHELARGKRVLEIGSYCGRSTACLAQSAASVVSVDPHDGRATPTPRPTLETFRATLAEFGVTDRVRVVVGTAADLDADAGPFDLVFIDGAHDYGSVRSDVLAACGLLAPGGVLAFHDYRTSPGAYDGRWDEGVTRTVEELARAGGEILSTHGTVAVVRPPARPLLEV
jgi:predicted O-methyltransferase YrrM